MNANTFENLPSRIQAAVTEAMPVGTSTAGLESFVHLPLAALGNRSIVETLDQDGYASESAIVQCCSVLKQLRTEASARSPFESGTAT
jgi:hypothetical protein